MKKSLKYHEPKLLDNLRTLWKFHVKKYGIPAKIIMTQKELDQFRQEMYGDPKVEASLFRGVPICKK